MTAPGLLYAGVGAFFGAGGILWAAPSPVPGGAAVLVALLTIAGIILIDRAGAIR